MNPAPQCWGGDARETNPDKKIAPGVNIEGRVPLNDYRPPGNITDIFLQAVFCDNIFLCGLVAPGEILISENLNSGD